MNSIVIAIIVLGAMALVFGLVLSLAGKAFAVKTDERLEPMVEALPGANCGGCGFAGCNAYAKAVLEGKAKIGLCAAGGDAAAQKMAEIMGVAAEKTERQVALVRCSGHHVVKKGQYAGISDCVAASKVAGGNSMCAYGCLGYGTCVAACKFGALSIVDGIARVDLEKCTGCFACRDACPRGVIVAVPYSENIIVGCASREKGAKLRKYCDIGCLGCHLCERTCQHDAIHVVDNLASIDPSKCVGCGECVDKCPRHLIVDIRRADTGTAAEPAAIAK